MAYDLIAPYDDRSSHDDNLTSHDEHKSNPMMDIIKINQINFSSPIANDTTTPHLDVLSLMVSPLILVDTSFSNDSLIKKSKVKKKKKLIYTITDSPDYQSFKINNLGQLSFIPQEIIDITFHEIVNDIKAEEHDSNKSQHALSPSIDYTYDKFVIVDDIKQDSSIHNPGKLLTYIELFMRQFEHFVSINYCSTKQLSSVIVKFSKYEGLVNAANLFKNVKHSIRTIFKGESFYLRHPSKYIVNSKKISLDIFFTVSSSHVCNLKIKGILKGINWTERDVFLEKYCNKCPSITSHQPPKYITSSNWIPITNPKYKDKVAINDNTQEDFAYHNPWSLSEGNSSSPQYNNSSMVNNPHVSASRDLESNHSSSVCEVALMN
ncbi:hypothetical protein C1645_814369 [Glomus cerebriforme]|uniref:Uncharacterized protein n=1 Tax=Glomus cerebriforme TaxID=658196 RepID=A0A397TFU9_9GLOM|nr:hypothetical protein C1645_814369 [Glomus cerebriforme]